MVGTPHASGAVHGRVYTAGCLAQSAGVIAPLYGMIRVDDSAREKCVTAKNMNMAVTHLVHPCGLGCRRVMNGSIND